MKDKVVIFKHHKYVDENDVEDLSKGSFHLHYIIRIDRNTKYHMSKYKHYRYLYLERMKYPEFGPVITNEFSPDNKATYYAYVERETFKLLEIRQLLQ